MGEQRTTITTVELERLLAGLEVGHERLGDHAMGLTYRSGTRATLLVYGAETSDDPGSSLQLRCGGTGYSNLAVAHVNRWNQRYRYTKAYLDEDDDPVIECDLDVSMGMSDEAVRSFVSGFGEAAAQFRSYLQLIHSGLVE